MTKTIMKSTDGKKYCMVNAKRTRDAILFVDEVFGGEWHMTTRNEYNHEKEVREIRERNK